MEGIMTNKIRYLIVQAGGKGTRMEHLTWNKPKCLISIHGKPMLYWLEDVFPGSEMYIISDYKKEVLEKYMKVNPPKFQYTIIEAEGTGTSSGLQKAREMIPAGESFGIVWSDLIFDGLVNVPEEKGNYVGITNKFKCRWSYNNGELIEEASDKTGVVGFFYFSKPYEIPKIPLNGEFVRFLSEVDGIKPIMIENVQEIGNIEAYYKLKANEINSRFFNSIKFEDNKVIKKSKRPEFDKLIEDEVKWYEYISEKNFNYIPKIYKLTPYIEMERLIGKHPYELKKYDRNHRMKILNNIFEVLDELHNIDSINYEREICHQVYVDKTIERIEKISYLIPNWQEEFFVVNNKKVRNLLNDKYKGEIENIFNSIEYSPSFTVIHGDPTFSNMIICEEKEKPFLFDPRGYFGKMKIFGDPLYDFSKLYYSVVGNYDQFNQKNFKIKINNKNIDLKISPNGWEDLEEVFKKKFGNKMRSLKIIHSLIWLSLAGYVLDDYDSILGAYFHGLELFEEAALI